MNNLDRDHKDEVNMDDFTLTDFELGVLLERTRSAYSRIRELELAQFGLSPEQAAILHTLQSKGSFATSDEIANNIIRQYHSVTSIVNRMEKNGLVEKVKTKRGRKYLIYITQKGENLYNSVPRHSIEMVLSGLIPEEKQQLAVGLQKMLSQGREMLGMNNKYPFLNTLRRIIT
jgi:DNA-binding MarR family transcriptional regulator